MADLDPSKCPKCGFQMTPGYLSDTCPACGVLFSKARASDFRSSKPSLTGPSPVMPARAPAPSGTVRPTAVTVIGWLYVAFGVLAALAGLFGTAMSLLIPVDRTPSPSRFDAPAPFGLLSVVFDHIWALTALQLLLGVFMAVAGAAFLKLRSWARPAVEAIAWAGLLYDLAFGAFWLWGVSSMGVRAGEAGGAAGTAFFTVFLAFGAVLILAFTIPPIVIIRAVRDRTVREALRAAGA